MEKMQWEREDYTTARDANDRAHWTAAALECLAGCMTDNFTAQEPEGWAWMVHALAQTIKNDCGVAACAICNSL